jgi:hypothetical protein
VFVYDKYILDDVGSNELKEIFLMGAGNYQHVVAVDFDGVTASEPVLEAWDDISMKTTENVVLGENVPDLSWIRGVTTTDGLPGAGWVGKPLAGSTEGYFLWLNNQAGALTVAKTLYFQLKVTIPASQEDSGNSQPILVVKFARA